MKNKYWKTRNFTSLPPSKQLHWTNQFKQYFSAKDALKWPINFIPEMNILTHGATLRSLYLYNWTIKGLKMKIPKEKFLKNQKTKTLRYLYYFLSYRHANSGEETNMKSAFPQLLTDTFNAFNSRSTIHVVIIFLKSFSPCNLSLNLRRKLLKIVGYSVNIHPWHFIFWLSSLFMRLSS